MSEGMSKKKQAEARAHRADIIKSYMKKSHTGGFSDIGYITTGPDADHTDQYIKQEIVPSRYLGKNMMVRAPRSGNLPDVYFDKLYTTLASSTQGGPGADKYDPPKNRFREGEDVRKKINESIKKVHEGKDFKMSNYPTPYLGSGSYAGCFQSKPFEHMPSDKNMLARGANASKKETFAPSNFKTKRAPKGSYGVPGTTFGKFYSLYVATPEMIAQREKDINRWNKKKLQFEKEKKELTDRPVFNGMSTARTTFDSKKASGVTGIFDEYVPDEETIKNEAKAAKKREKALARKAKADAKKSKPLDLPQFRYSSTLKSGEQGYFNKFPDSKVVVDEAEEKKRETRAAKKRKADEKSKKKKGIKDLSHPMWKPVSGLKSSVVSSLLPRYY